MKFSKFLPVLAVLAFVSPLAACTEAPPARGTPDLTFDQLPKVSLNVSRIELVDNYLSPMKAPYVEHLFKPTPEEATKKLISQQLQAAGGENVLRAIIEDASVSQEDLPPEKDFQSMFHAAPPRVYHGKVTVRFELYNEQAPEIVLGHADLNVVRNKTVTGDVSLVERDEGFFNMTEAMMHDLSQGLKTTVKDTFGSK